MLVYNDHEHLVELFERVHFDLFFVSIVIVCIAMVRLSIAILVVSLVRFEFFIVSIVIVSILRITARHTHSGR